MEILCGLTSKATPLFQEHAAELEPSLGRWHDAGREPPRDLPPQVSHCVLHFLRKFSCWKAALTYLFRLIKWPNYLCGIPDCLQLNRWESGDGVPSKGESARESSHPQAVNWSRLPTKDSFVVPGGVVTRAWPQLTKHIQELFL